MSQLVFGEDSNLVKSLSSLRRVLDFALAALAGAVIVGGVAYFFFDAGFGKDMMKTGIVIFFLLETVLGIVGYYQRRERSKARANKFGRNIEQVESAETVRLVEEKPFAPVQSVVENRTELFPGENRTRKFD